MKSSASVRSEPLPVSILGVAFDSVTMTETVSRMESMIGSRQPHYVATANVDFVVQARRDLELRRILFDADLVLCDGTPLVWASRWLGNPLPERCAGADVVPELIRVSARKGYRLFLLGASPEAAERAVARLQDQYPGLQIAGHYSPPFKPLLEMDHAEIHRRVKAANPDVLLVAFGCPKQEKWIAMNYESLGVPVCIGVGATIDFLGGCMKRAPVWMQRSGTEWLFRLAQEPRRLFKRYAFDLAFFGTGILRQLWTLRQRGQKNAAHHCTAASRTNGWQHIQLPPRFDFKAVERSRTLLNAIDVNHRHCVLEMESVRWIDSTGLAILTQLQKRLRRQGRCLILLAPQRAILQTFRSMGLSELFVVAKDLEHARRIRAAQAQEQSAAVQGSSPIVWQGEITVRNAEEVLRETQARSWTLPEVRVDLSRVRYIDSTGAGVMVRLSAWMQKSGQRLVFSGASSAVQNVLRCSRMESLLAAPLPTASATRSSRELFLSHQSSN
jgi:N-acetylglucosaminyldiphosphoundecaprenol N-acetyl-beta-D-mannosaminyltransferase